ncbi:hypothetical protein [Phenylobacterium sp.]|uniref:hypothetical protein n=1 Tax=Phenylobacterium sp. TaxID=1871053 RepID=UPI0027270FEA|nr:hypothetical protein [Phenylobacterium sp.]MDO8380796.1 hypothetical protein [Phenylobacterium sp.]
MARFVLLSALAGALVALAMYAVGSAVPPIGPVKNLWLVFNTLIDPSWLLGVSTFYEVSMGSYGARRVAMLAAFNAPIYAAAGWALWMARHRSGWFWLAVAAITGPFVIAAAYVAFVFVT